MDDRDSKPEAKMEQQSPVSFAEIKKNLKTSIMTVLSGCSVTSYEDYRRILSSLHGSIHTTFSHVLSDLGSAADELSRENRLTFQEAFSQACDYKSLNEEVLSQALNTLMSTVFQLQKHAGTADLRQVNEEYSMGLTEAECQELVELYRQKSPLGARTL